MLKELDKIKIKDEEKYVKIFSDLVNSVSSNPEKFLTDKEFVKEKKDYYIVSEPNRMQSCIVNLVPKNLIKLFRKMKKKYPDGFLGFTVYCGRAKNRDVRTSLFGIKCISPEKLLIKE
jgi:hypothetical protein